MREPFYFGRLPRHSWVLGVVVLAAAGLSIVVQARALRSTPQDSAQQGAATQSPAKNTPAEIATPLPKGKKLILNDGTFQIVREYQREGDRVRYYSLERSAWEEIPAALIDWDATKKAEAEQDAKDQALAEKIKAGIRAARVADLNSDTSFEVRPGVILPDPAGLYALDGKQIVTMRQDLAVSHADKARAIERIVSGVPLIKTRAKIEIPGKQAAVRIHTTDPEFYFRTADQREPEVSLLRTTVKGDVRELTTMSVDAVEERTYKNDEVPLLLWDAAQGLYRLTIEGSMDPGEYAIVEKSSEGMSLYVWDFGVDANAGADAVASPSKP